MTTQSVTILNTLPVYAGNPRENEPPFKNDTDARTFIRSLETYFCCNKITKNNQKIQTMYSLVDKKRGDALDFVSSYVGLNVAWEVVKKEFLLTYPSTAHELRLSTKELLSIKLEEKHIVGSASRLERTAREVTEAYLSNQGLSKGDFDLDSLIYTKTNSPARLDSDDEDEEDKEEDEEEGEGDQEEATDEALAGGQGRAQAAASPEYIRSKITLAQLLQNYTMHVITSATINPKVYDKLEKMGPRKSGTRLRAEIVKASERHNGRTKREVRKPKDEYIWKTTGEPQQRTLRRTIAEDRRRDTTKCYNCGKEGHMRRTCPACAYCQSTDHKVKNCKKRIREAKGKYCNYCKVADSHDTAECLKRKAANRDRKNVRMVYQRDTDEGEETDVFDPTYDDDPSDSDSSEQ